MRKLFSCFARWASWSIALVLLYIPCKAQPFVDVLNVRYQYFMPVKYLKDNLTELKTDQKDVSVLLPLERKNKDVVLVGSHYTEFDFKTNGKSNVSTTLYSTSLFAGYEKQWKNEKWKSLFMVIPKINADFKNIGSQDFQAGGVVLFKYKKNENLKYHFGAYYNREFFGNFFIPLLGIDWKINDRLNLFGDLPASMNLELKLSKHFYSGLAYYSYTNSYRINGMAVPARSYAREGDEFWGYDLLRLYANVYMTSHLVVFAEGGYTFKHIYQEYTEKNKPDITEPVFQESKDGWFINSGLAYRFRLDKND